ncbi:MAG TPA: hypothetical protein VHO06_23280 [Polyangia bacterium]|nr:hypothetical protein [Polyangia bacterium]
MFQANRRADGVERWPARAYLDIASEVAARVAIASAQVLASFIRRRLAAPKRRPQIRHRGPDEMPRTRPSDRTN